MGKRGQAPRGPQKRRGRPRKIRAADTRNAITRFLSSPPGEIVPQRNPSTYFEVRAIPPSPTRPRAKSPPSQNSIRVSRKSPEYGGERLVERRREKQQFKSVDGIRKRGTRQTKLSDFLSSRSSESSSTQRILVWNTNEVLSSSGLAGQTSEDHDSMFSDEQSVTMGRVTRKMNATSTPVAQAMAPYDPPLVASTFDRTPERWLNNGPGAAASVIEDSVMGDCEPSPTYCSPWPTAITSSPIVQGAEACEPAVNISNLSSISRDGSQDLPNFHLIDLQPSSRSLSPEPSDETSRAARELFSILKGEFNGCDTEEHVLGLQTHMERNGDNHHPISATYRSWIDDRSIRRSEVGLTANGFAVNHGRRRNDFVSNEVLEDVFEGRREPATENDAPYKNVCLHLDHVSDGVPITSFDVDSAILFPKSLGAIRIGFDWCAAKDVSHTITSNIHIDKTITYRDAEHVDRVKTLQLQEIPHLYMGSVNGFEGSSLYIFFPMMFNPDKRFTFMEDRQVNTFIDQLFLPALRLFGSKSNLPGYPQGSQAAEHMAKAKSSETRTGNDSGSRRVLSRFFVEGGPSLHAIWEEMQRIWTDERTALGEFQEAFLMIDMKGEKARHRVEGSLRETLVKFQDTLEAALQVGDDWMDSLYIDIGREILGPYGSSDHHGRDHAGQATVYMWRKCCLEKMVDHWQRSAFGQGQGVIDFYNIGYLRDASCMNVTPPKKSWIHRAGWVYGQFYSSVKQIVDAQKVYPFQARHFEELAVDPEVWTAMASAARVSHAKSRDTIERGFVAAKQRTDNALRQTENTSYGSRMEFRVTWPLVQAILKLATRHEIRERHTPYRLDDHPEAVWSIPTRVFTQFLRHNFDKLVSTIEIGIATSPTSGVKLERTQFVQVLFKCLQTFFNCSLIRYSVLAEEDKTDDQGKVSRGLGMLQTMRRYGFAWFQSGVDWHKLRFDPGQVEKIIGVDGRLISWYEANATHQLLDRAEDFSQSIEWLLQRTFRTPEMKLEAITLVVHILLEQYRIECVTALRKEFVKPDIDVSKVTFSHEGFGDIYKVKFNQVSGNRTKCPLPSQVFEWVWGPSEAHKRDPKYPRAHFEYKTFRLWVEQLRRATQDSLDLQALLLTQLEHDFFYYHWLVPYPDGNGTLISTNKTLRIRQFYATSWGTPKPTKSQNAPAHRGKQVVWLQEKVRRGTPPPLPTILAHKLHDLESRWFKKTTAEIETAARDEKDINGQ